MAKTGIKLLFCVEAIKSKRKIRGKLGLVLSFGVNMNLRVRSDLVPGH